MIQWELGGHVNVGSERMGARWSVHCPYLHPSNSATGQTEKDGWNTDKETHVDRSTEGQDRDRYTIHYTQIYNADINVYILKKVENTAS